MKQIGKLRHRVSIICWQDAPNLFAALDRTYTILQDVWGDLSPTNGGRQWKDQQIDGNPTHKLTIRWQPNLVIQADTMGIAYQSRYFRIIRAMHNMEDRRHITIELEETHGAECKVLLEDSQ